MAAGDSPGRRWESVLDAALAATADDVVASLGQPDDAVATALADALARASAAGEWSVVASLAAELQARRLARAGVPDLGTVRARRGR